MNEREGNRQTDRQTKRQADKSDNVRQNRGGG